jgi:hypothetical protein
MTEHGTISHLTLTLSMVKAKLASWILDYDRGITGKLGLQKARLYCSLLMRVRMAFNELSMHRCYFECNLPREIFPAEPSTRAEQCLLPPTVSCDKITSLQCSW